MYSVYLCRIGGILCTWTYMILACSSSSKCLGEILVVLLICMESEHPITYIPLVELM